MNKTPYSFDYIPNISLFLQKYNKSSFDRFLLNQLEKKIRKQNIFLTELIREEYLTEKQAQSFVLNQILEIRQETQLSLSRLFDIEYENMIFEKNPQKLEEKIDYFLRTRSDKKIRNVDANANNASILHSNFYNENA